MRQIATAVVKTQPPDPIPSQASHPFTVSELDRLVTLKSPGVYSLGYLDEHGRFTVRAIGRADEDLRDELSVRMMLLMGADMLSGPGDSLRAQYSRFTFQYTASAEEAFERECLEYHRVFDQLDNKMHPSRDENNTTREVTGPRWFCPIWQCAWNY